MADSCAYCIAHPGWAHADESRRRDSVDVCRFCFGSSVEQPQPEGRWTNTDRVFASLTGPQRRRVFQALCTERDRLDENGRHANVRTSTAQLVEVFAAALVADDCCGEIRETHAYCPTLLTPKWRLR